MLKVSIIGATGYVGLELVRILSMHPETELSKLVSQSYVGKKYSDVYPSLRGVCDIECCGLDISELAKSSDLVITALPHGASKEIIPELLKHGVKVIDHSAYFRYRNTSTYETVYGGTHGQPDLQAEAVYGLPELYREQIKNANLIANPGCYPTCSILGLAPLLKSKTINPSSILISAVSGVSGAGRQENVAHSFCELESNFKAYGVTTHRHTSEIEQEISALAGKDVIISFTPHLAPFKRGMLATIHADLAEGFEKCSLDDILYIYTEFYKNENFVRVLPNGTFPEVKYVVGSNFVDIGVAIDKRLNRLVIVSALDNMLKGAAGQAVQVLNIMAGLNETTGLMFPAMQL